MKFLEYTPLDSLSLFLTHLNVGESTLKGSLEAYSCKHAGTDRKLSFSLEHEILDYLNQYSENNSASPVGDLSNKASRKTLIYLVLTLGHLYPDYDFSAIQAHHFFSEEGWDSFKQVFNTYMFEAEKEWSMINDDSSLLESMRGAIDELVKLDECEIYSYNPDFSEDPFMERGVIWSLNFFFYNRKLKRVVSFRCCCISNLVADGFLVNGSLEDEEDGNVFTDMEM